MNKKMLLLGWITLFGFGLSGLALVHFFQKTSIPDLLNGHWPIPIQLVIGLLVGIIGAFFAQRLINAPFFKNEKQKYHELINFWTWTKKGIIFISICAGVGEELLFRAGIQPFLGLWPTAFFFVLIHGYLNPWNWRISVYGSIMVLFIALLGLLFENGGILSAIAAHAVFDAILLFSMVEKKDVNQHTSLPL